MPWRAMPRAVALSGDVHFSAEHVAGAAARAQFIEWTVTSITSPNLDDKMGWPRGAESRNYEAALLRNLPDMKWCDLDSHGFLIVDAGTAAAVVPVVVRRHGEGGQRRGRDGARGRAGGVPGGDDREDEVRS